VIWFIGNRGMLGTDLQAEFQTGNVPFVGTDVELDIRNEKAVSEFAQKQRPTWIVNCAAYTAVDQAEDEPELARALNAVAVGNIARAAAQINARVIHISTDYVFSGSSNVPYRESEPVSPTGIYGRTKAEGEQFLTVATGSYFIFRTAWLYGIHGKSFVRTMLRLFNERKEVSVVNDQRGTPTYTVDLARLFAKVINSDSTDFGVYHFTNRGETTWYGFAKEIYSQARARGLLTGKCNIKPVSTAEYPTKAMRPAYSVLSKERVAEAFGIDIPDWKDALSRFLDQMEEEL